MIVGCVGFAFSVVWFLGPLGRVRFYFWLVGGWIDE
jgi:hypothetical protein